MADVAPDILAAAVTRVTAYLDALDATAARRLAAGREDQQDDVVHGYNDHDLRRSDLRALLAALPAPRPDALGRTAEEVGRG